MDVDGVVCDVCQKSKPTIKLEGKFSVIWLCEECSDGVSKLHNKHMEKLETYIYAPGDREVVKIDAAR